MKSQAMNILTVLGSLLIGWQASSADSIGEILEREMRQFRTPCHNQLYQNTRISITNLKPNTTLEGLYCERMSIRTVGDAFAEGRDLPAEKLNVGFEPIGWATAEPGHFDLAPIDELNAQAAGLWNKFVECHGSPEKARRAYFDLSPKCGLDVELKKFNQSIQLYLQTTQILLWSYKISGKYHPLLTQILLETVSATSWLPGVPHMSAEIEVYVDYMTKYLLAGGLIEHLETSKFFGAYVLRMAIKNPSIHAIFLRLNRKINSMMLLSQNTSLHHCETVGLWPGVSRAVVKGFEVDSNNSALGSRDLSETVSKACGDVRYTDSPYSYYTKASYALVYLFRNMAVRFEREQK